MTYRKSFNSPTGGSSKTVDWKGRCDPRGVITDSLTARERAEDEEVSLRAGRKFWIESELDSKSSGTSAFTDRPISGVGGDEASGTAALCKADCLKVACDIFSRLLPEKR